MPEHREVMLGGGQHTVYSDEAWYLVTAGEGGEVVLEVRFQSDAPDRTGWPTWAGTELCVSRAGEEAVGRLHYASPADLVAAARPSVVPEGVWARAADECRKLVPPSQR